MLVGHKDGWLVADKMSTYMGTTFTTNKLIPLGKQAIIGIAGETSLKFKVPVAKLTRSKDLIKALCDFMDSTSNGSLMVLVRKGHRPLLITDDGAWLEAPHDYWAIGSGGDLVTGYLAGHGRCDVNVARAAVSWASQFTPSISKETDWAALK